MNTNQNKYIAACENFKESRWTCIKLATLAETLTADDITQLLPIIQELAIKEAQAKYDEYVSLRAPQILLAVCIAPLNKAKAGKSVTVATLARRLKKI